jgi:hypothetical protein
MSMTLLTMKLGCACPEDINGTSSKATCKGRTMPPITEIAFSYAWPILKSANVALKTRIVGIVSKMYSRKSRNT